MQHLPRVHPLTQRTPLRTSTLDPHLLPHSSTWRHRPAPSEHHNTPWSRVTINTPTRRNLLLSSPHPHSGTCSKPDTQICNRVKGHHRWARLPTFPHLMNPRSVEHQGWQSHPNHPSRPHKATGHTRERLRQGGRPSRVKWTTHSALRDDNVPNPQSSHPRTPTLLSPCNLSPKPKVERRSPHRHTTSR